MALWQTANRIKPTQNIWQSTTQREPRHQPCLKSFYVGQFPRYMESGHDLSHPLLNLLPPHFRASTCKTTEYTVSAVFHCSRRSLFPIRSPSISTFPVSGFYFHFYRPRPNDLRASRKPHRIQRETTATTIQIGSPFYRSDRYRPNLIFSSESKTNERQLKRPSI